MADDAEWTPKQDMSLLCRVCANQHDYLIPIFQGEGLDHDMPTKMDKHLPIKVRESDKLPTQMCYQCASTIIAWSELHTNCLAADKKLKGMLRINEKKMGVVDTADDDAGSDHYEDAYDDGGGGGDDDDEDFEKEIKQLISDAGVELGSKTAKASKRPSRAAATRKRKSEVTITPVKRETKKPKTEPSASKSSTALLKPKEEVVSNEDRLQIWSCCVCCATFVSCEKLIIHASQHQDGNVKIEENVIDSIVKIKCEIDNNDNYCFLCRNTFISHSSQHYGDSFLCYHCNQFFTEKRTLRFHLNIVHDVKNLEWYACKECCNYLYKSEQGMLKHLENVHHEVDVSVTSFRVNNIQDITFPCKDCGKKCVLAKFCTKHSKNKKRRKKAKTSRKDKCKEHCRSHECQMCRLMLKNCSELWSHLFKDHTDKDKGFKCNICTTAEEMITFKYPPVIVYHMKMEHGMKLFLTSEVAEFKRKSEVIVNGVSKYKCFECATVVTRFNSLEDHYLVVHYSKEKSHKCDICGWRFHGKGNLTSHMRSHTGERKFVCEVCGAAFVQWASLYYHKFTHSDKRLECSQCGKTFTNPNTLRSHKYTHSGKRTYVCEECGRKFNCRSILRGHMSVHSTERPHVCEQCNARFKVKKNLVQHYKTHQKK